METLKALEYLAMVSQDYLNKLDKSAQLAVAEKAQLCVNMIENDLRSLYARQLTEAESKAPAAGPVEPIDS